MKAQALKIQNETDKVMGEAVDAFVSTLMEEGFLVKRAKMGTRGTREVLDAWRWPAELNTTSSQVPVGTAARPTEVKTSWPGPSGMSGIPSASHTFRM